MRTCSDYDELQLWAAVPDAAAICRPQHLAVIRFELIERGGKPYGWIDLTFAADERTCVVPGVLVDLAPALGGEASALAWPRAAAVVLDDDDDAAATGALVLAQFARWLAGRSVPAEAVAVVAACAAFEPARAASELGAAPLRAVLPRLAPWIFAARLVPAQLDAADTALGAAVLRRFGVRANGRFDERAAAWYGLAPSAGSGAPALVALSAPATAAEEWRAIGVAVPEPMDVGIAFVAADAPGATRFWVHASPRATAPPAVRATAVTRRPAVPLAFVVREDFRRAPDADSDELDALTALVRRSGVEARIEPYGALDSVAAGTLPIVAGDVRDAEFAAALERAARRGGPFIAWPQPIGEYPEWHERALYAALREAHDDARLGAFVRAYDLRALALGNLPVAEPPQAEPQRARVAAALAAAAVILLPATQSLAVVAQTYGGRERPLRPIPPVLPPGDGAGALLDGAPYVFVHGAAEPRSAIVTAVAALRDAPVPAVIAVGVADAVYAAALRRLAGSRTTILENPPGEIVDALYAGAALYVDPAVRPRGLARAVRAARAGALPVVFADSPLAPLLDPDTVVPRRGVADLRDALTVLWHSPLRRSRARAAALALGRLDRPDVALAELFDAVCDLTGG